MGASSFDPILSNVLPATLLIHVCPLFLLKVTRTYKRHDTPFWGHSQAFPTSIFVICKNSGQRPGTFSKWEIEHYRVLLTLCQPTYNTKVKKKWQYVGIVEQQEQGRDDSICKTVQYTTPPYMYISMHVTLCCKKKIVLHNLNSVNNDV